MRKRIAFLGGDRRLEYAAGYFSDKGYEVIHYLYNSETLPEKLTGDVVLPLPAFRDNALFSPFSDAKISEKEIVSAVESGSHIFGGMMTDSFVNFCNEKSISAYDYYKNEALLLKNADLTARAVLMLFEEEKIKTDGEEIFILGFGRCGSALCRHLSKNGGHVTAVTSKSSADGFNFIPFDELKNKIGSASIVINTVPSLVIGEKELNEMKATAVAAEIASNPFGIDFDAAAKRNIKVIRAPSLPGRFLPKEAGEAIAKTVESLLGDG